MRRSRVLPAAAATLVALLLAAPAAATIHEKASLECGNAPPNPPGQTPAFLGDEKGAGDGHADLRAITVTGVFVGVDPETGEPIFDFTVPAANGNNGEAHCAALRP
jgi:hypothetical protein